MLITGTPASPCLVSWEPDSGTNTLSPGTDCCPVWTQHLSYNQGGTHIHLSAFLEMSASSVLGYPQVSLWPPSKGLCILLPVQQRGRGGPAALRTTSVCALPCPSQADWGNTVHLCWHGNQQLRIASVTSSLLSPRSDRATSDRVLQSSSH